MVFIFKYVFRILQHRTCLVLMLKSSPSFVITDVGHSSGEVNLNKYYNNCRNVGMQGYFVIQGL